METKLTEFQGRKGRPERPVTVAVLSSQCTIQRAVLQAASKAGAGAGAGAGRAKLPGLLCCTARAQPASPAHCPAQPQDPRLRRIENAFRKFDVDGDGVLSWDEFLQVPGSQ